MKQILTTSALAFLLLASAGGTALAQDHDHERGGQQGHPGGPPGGPPGGGERHQGSPSMGLPQGGGSRSQPAPGAQLPGGAGGFHHQGAAPAPQPVAVQRHDERGPVGAQGQRFQGGSPGMAPNAGFRHDGAPPRAAGLGGGRFQAWGGRPGGQVPRWQAGRYPPVMTWNQERYRAGFYRPPPGYYYRPWGYGEFLPRPWWIRDYWLMNFLDFDLPYPPPGFIWVRVGPDALMIDQFNGRIVQVVRGIFW